MGSEAILALSIFLITYAIIISEKIHRTIISLFGGLLMICFGILDQENAIHHIDFNTLGLLIGMMIIVTITAQTGLFGYIAIWSAKKVKGDPIKILIVLGHCIFISIFRQRYHCTSSCSGNSKYNFPIEC